MCVCVCVCVGGGGGGGGGGGAFLESEMKPDYCSIHGPVPKNWKQTFDFPKST